VRWEQEHRLGSCGRALGERVALGVAEVDGRRRGVFLGVETCGNAKACLHCGIKVRSELAGDVGTVLRTHIAGGGFVLFLTLTSSHDRDDSCRQVLDDVMSSWTRMNKSRLWRKLKRWLGLVDFIRVTEVTESAANGWHPHHHVALLIERPIGLDEDFPEELEEVRREIDGAWYSAVKSTGRTVDLQVGVDLVPVRDEAGIGRYVSKVEMELTRSDLKGGRKGSRSHWQVGLDAAGGCGRSEALWVEFVEATAGRRWLSTSKGLWQRFGIVERSDEEIAEELPDVVEEVVLIDAEVYRVASRADGLVLTELRHLVESGASAEVLCVVVGRRLGRDVELSLRSGDGDVPTIRFANRSGGPVRHDQDSASSRSASLVRPACR
jgi:hypothetical protein